MGLFPLAIYTAGRGLAWTYLQGSIPYATLDRCRQLLGPLPDFEGGEKGYEGVVAEGDHVFAIRCFSVPKWDFLGRDATYLAVSWIQRARSVLIDWEKLLRAPELNEPLREPPPVFRCDQAWTPFPSAPLEDGILIKRRLA